MSEKPRSCKASMLSGTRRQRLSERLCRKGWGEAKALSQTLGHFILTSTHTGFLFLCWFVFLSKVSLRSPDYPETQRCLCFMA